MAASRAEDQLTLSAAALRLAQPDELNEYVRLKDAGHGGLFIWTVGGTPSAYEQAEARFRELTRRFQERLLERLISGGADATAVDTRQPITAPRVPIRSDLWPLLEVDFEASTAKLDAVVLRDIRVVLRKSPPRTTAGVERRLEAWLRERLRRRAPGETKQSIRSEALAALSDASMRSFNRAWRSVAPSSAKRPGRRKS